MSLLPKPDNDSFKDVKVEHYKALAQFTTHHFVQVQLQVVFLKGLALTFMLLVVVNLVGISRWGVAQFAIALFLSFTSSFFAASAIQQRRRMWNEIINRACNAGHQIPPVMRKMY